MFVPYNTDAPVYHWPYATVGLIVANVLVTVAIKSSPDAIPWEHLVLTHGQGLQPLQWVTSNLTHLDVGHLIGNMFFLWAFGLVVEGKLGWRRFLATYFVIAVTQQMIEQILMLGYSGALPSYSAGASPVLYGLMAMSAVWAPKNDIEFFYWFGIFMGTVSFAIGLICVAYVCLDFTFVIGANLLYRMVGGTGIIALAQVLHVMGAAIGFPLAIVMLKRKVVDCEGWDLFHVWQGDAGGKEEAARLEQEAERRHAQQHAAEQVSFVERNRPQLLQLSAAGHVDAALKLYGKLLTADPSLQLTRDELLAIIRGLHNQQKWSASAPFMAELVDRFPQGSEPVRLKLAQICVVALGRPGRALDLLEALDTGQLSPEQHQLSRQVARKAKTLQAAGTVELDDGGW